MFRLASEQTLIKSQPAAAAAAVETKTIATDLEESKSKFGSGSIARDESPSEQSH